MHPVFRQCSAQGRTQGERHCKQSCCKQLQPGLKMNPCSPFPAINWILAATKVIWRAEWQLLLMKKACAKNVWTLSVSYADCDDIALWCALLSEEMQQLTVKAVTLNSSLKAAKHYYPSKNTKLQGCIGGQKKIKIHLRGLIRFNCFSWPALKIKWRLSQMFLLGKDQGYYH